MCWIAVLGFASELPTPTVPPGPVGSSQDRRAKKPFRASASFETRTLVGWNVRIDTRLRSGDLGARAIGLLEDELREVARLVPEKAVDVLRKVPIWLCLDEGTGAGAEYHPDKGWLEKNGYNPDKAKAVEIGDAADFLREIRRQPMMVLHELAHAYHDQALGFGHAEIKAAYEAAVKAGTYESVLFWDNRKVRHYALTDPMEYFAEATEAFFGVNDFFPFVRAELREHDPEITRVLHKVWGESVR